MRLEISEFTTWVTAAEAAFAVVSVIFGSETVTSVIYLGVGAVTVVLGVSVRNIALAVSYWRIRP